MRLTHGSPPWNKGSNDLGGARIMISLLNLPSKDQDPAFLFDKRGRRKAKALMLIDLEMQAITEAKSHSIHGSKQAM
ncbi:hypothetical protein Tco_0573930 [Tanacetum coccineum]